MPIDTTDTDTQMHKALAKRFFRAFNPNDVCVWIDDSVTNGVFSVGAKLCMLFESSRKRGAALAERTARGP